MSPLIQECERLKRDFFVIHTGQHYSHEMDTVFFEELGLKKPQYHLGIKSHSPFLKSEHIARMLIPLEEILIEEKPTAVLVQGDTNTVLAAALCVSKLRTRPVNIDIQLGHVEAGLRSFDRRMTEEVNRVLADHMSDLLFAPSAAAKANLRREAIPSARIFVTGNTIVDVVRSHMDSARQSDILKRLNLTRGNYFFVTVHRQENVDSPERLKDIFLALEHLAREYHFPIIYPIHPRARKMMQEFGYAPPAGILAIEPIGFLESLCLQMHAALILTDSGGIQEEASILHVPCVTLRDNTERPETIAAGYNMLAGTNAKKIVRAVRVMRKKRHVWKPLYGNGTAAKKILRMLAKKQ